jgi:toxin ParE1/3/4
MRVRWAPSAAADLWSISEYLKLHHPQFVDTTVRRIYSQIRGLKKFPNRGRPGEEPGTRGILFPPTPYIGVYRVKDECIEVLHIFHGAQDR